ncbi:hypothetical protein D9756_008355 [Leucocoprinus leucothites]|uniref:DUF6533 domain-containing protein n=1 Tax=Leucocoprinus leucothites TaxID=201217 RepID=A0A8H5FVW6_9AGAR|nr:hypothetical protein D9756_008355 [Leucoagaricus leucothites]
MDTIHDNPWFFAGIVPSRMVCFAAGTVLLYDHLTTLDQEINLVWKRRLGTNGTALFLINRYSHYIHAFSIISEYWFIAPSERTCLRWDIANCVLVGFSITVCEVVLALRTWAMWKLSRRVLYFFLIMACVKFPVVIAALAESLIHSRYLRISGPGSPAQFVCISPIIGRWSWESLAFVSVIITETGIASLTVVRAIEARKSASRWYFRIHYMGVIYYIFTLGLTILNVIGTLYLRNIGVLPFAFAKVYFVRLVAHDLDDDHAIQTTKHRVRRAAPHNSRLLIADYITPFTSRNESPSFTTQSRSHLPHLKFLLLVGSVSAALRGSHVATGRATTGTGTGSDNAGRGKNEGDEKSDFVEHID